MALLACKRDPSHYDLLILIIGVLVSAVDTADSTTFHFVTLEALLGDAV